MSLEVKVGTQKKTVRIILTHKPDECMTDTGRTKQLRLIAKKQEAIK